MISGERIRFGIVSSAMLSNIPCRYPSSLLLPYLTAGTACT
jgi:hypothetical protein